LRAAHVGVAMGQRGTDVAREAAAIVLLDDNFASIVRAVRLGRRIFDNLRKSMSYLLAVHVPIAGLALLPVLLGWPSVLFPTHIAFLELVIDPACSLAFENEPAEPDLMNRPPRDTRAPLFNAAMIGQAMLQGLGALALLLLGYGWALQMHDEPTARAVAFVALVASNLALIFANRSNDAPVWRALRTPNATLWTVAGAAVALLLLVTEWPAAATLLRFSALSPGLLAAAFGWGLFSLVWFEAIKAVRRRALRKHNGVS
jgi:Ca2+-transporting ATPase